VLRRGRRLLSRSGGIGERELRRIGSVLRESYCTYYCTVLCWAVIITRRARARHVGGGGKAGR